MTLEITSSGRPCGARFTGVDLRPRDATVVWHNRCVLREAPGGDDGHERLLCPVTIGQSVAA